MKKAPAPQFPMTITKGSASVKIYRGENRGKPMFTVSYVGPSGRQRENFFDLAEAEKQAKSRAEKLAAGDLEALRLTGQERQLYVAAAEAIRPTGLSLDVAARDFAAAYAELGSNLVLEACRHYKRTVLRGLPEMTVTKAVDDYIAAKETEGQSDLYLKDLRGLLGRFKAAFNCQLREVTADMLRDYLQKLGVGAVTRNNHLRLIRGLFTHARAHGWLNKSESTAAEAIGTAKPKIKAVEIYRPDEMAALLSAADDQFRVWLVLIGFCGVRREEVSRLDWSAIDLESDVIIIPPDVAKTKRKRKITLQANAAAWLALTPEQKRKGPIFTIDPRKRMAKTLKAANAARTKHKLPAITWKTNGLRHSFCSYRLEQCRNAGDVALEAGNSAGIIMRHYHEVVSAKDAASWWNLAPADERKITTLAA